MNNLVITLDIDWVPDFIIDSIAFMLVKERVRATWFITHASPAVERLRENPDLFELGLHPNFLPGSTQGETPEEILDNLLSIVPDAISIRTHSLFQSWPLLRTIVKKTGVKVDVSIFLPGALNIQPVVYRVDDNDLLRIPFFWGDDYEMSKSTPNWHLAPILKAKGLKVMNFHPIYIYLNSGSRDVYQKLRHAFPHLAELKPELGKLLAQDGEGPQKMFRELTHHLASLGTSQRIRDLYATWNEMSSADDVG